MGGWRIKLVFLLVVYFAGFATAIYSLAPVPDSESCQVDEKSEKSLMYSALNSDEFAQSFSAVMRKCIGFGKKTTCRISRFIKQKLDERQTDK